MKKYLVSDGYVRSENDGEMHYITHSMVMRLFKVNPKECVTSSELRGRKTENLIHLYPQNDGDYTLAKQSTIKN